MSAIVAIPARLESSRLPRKVLIDILGKPMIQHVYQRCLGSTKACEVWVLTDSTVIRDVVIEWGGKVKMTSSECESGTERIVSVLDELEADIIVNVQADEPLITGALIDEVVSALENHSWDVSTTVFRIDSLEELLDPNLVKVVRSVDGTGLYFSRSVVPHVRGSDEIDWLGQAPFWGHIGIYGYRRDALLRYPYMPKGYLEGAEKLEQLRFLEAGQKIGTVVTNQRLWGVDVQEDVEKVTKLLQDKDDDCKQISKD